MSYLIFHKEVLVLCDYFYKMQICLKVAKKIKNKKKPPHSEKV